MERKTLIGAITGSKAVGKFTEFNTGSVGTRSSQQTFGRAQLSGQPTGIEEYTVQIIHPSSYNHIASGSDKDITEHGHSSHGQTTQTGSRTTGRRGSGHSEYSDSEGHSGGSHTHSGHTHGQAGSQHGESGSAVHGRQGTIHGQTGDTTRHAHYGHGESIQTSSRTIGRRESGHSEYSDSEGHSVGSHTHSGHTHGQAGSQHGESGSVIHGRLETTHGQTGDSTRHGHSGYGQSTETGSRSTRTSHFQSHSSERQRHGSSHVWKHGSYGPAEYDYGHTGYGPSGGRRKSICNSHLLWSIDSATNEQLSRH
nr:filaggrin-2-like [Macaca nemestrina]